MSPSRSSDRAPASARCRLGPALLAVMPIALLLGRDAAFGRSRAGDDPFGPSRVGERGEFLGFTTKSSYLPMRDGARLAVDVSLPKQLQRGRALPTLIRATRHWRAVSLRFVDGHAPDTDGFARFFTSFGYAVVTVDVRGTGASSGRWRFPWSRDQAEDLGQVVDWVVAQPWSDGRVGGMGDGYEGSAAEWLAAAGRRAVKAVVLRFADLDPYGDALFPGGVFQEWFAREWSTINRQFDSNTLRSRRLSGRIFVKGVRPVGGQGRERLEEALRDHESNTDVYAAARRVTDREELAAALGVSFDTVVPSPILPETRSPAVALSAWGSWLDGTTADGVIRRFQSRPGLRLAVIGPWSHGARYDADPFRAEGADVDPRPWDQRHAALRFLDAHLKGEAAGERTGPALVYYTLGEGRWKQTARWPLPESRCERWYLAAGQQLLRSVPDADSGTDLYTVDFEATTGLFNRWRSRLDGADVRYPDRATADRRLLTYTSPPLDRDTEITGHPEVSLWITSTAPDGAFFVYLEDVDPVGRVTYLTEGQLRARHRAVASASDVCPSSEPCRTFSADDAAPLTPGQATELRFRLLPTSVLVRKGHRIRVALAGADKDTFGRVPPEGVPVVSVLRDHARASFVELPIVPRD